MGQFDFGIGNWNFILLLRVLIVFLFRQFWEYIRERHWSPRLNKVLVWGIAWHQNRIWESALTSGTGYGTGIGLWMIFSTGIGITFSTGTWNGLSMMTGSGTGTGFSTTTCFVMYTGTAFTEMAGVLPYGIPPYDLYQNESVIIN